MRVRCYISADLNDKNDILHKRNKMAIQINNVLCYFSQLGLDRFVKLKALKAYRLNCSSLYIVYGTVSWDVGHSSVESVCCARRSGLRRVGLLGLLGLPNTAHCSLSSPLFCTLPFIDELFKRFILFAQRCISID